MARIIFNADDAGLHPEIDKGINLCINAGIVNSVSVIANSDSFNPQLISQWQAKGIAIGVHLSWLGVKWLTQPYNFHDWSGFIRAFVFRGEKFRREVREEAQAQIEKLKSYNIQISHLDSHQHVHHLPVLWGYCRRLQVKEQIPRIRCAKAARFSLARKNAPGLMLQALASMQFAQPMLPCAGLKYAGNYTKEGFVKEMEATSGQDVEFIVHPGCSNAELNKHFGHWNFNWEREMEGLLGLKSTLI